jgi:miniconductance mechanosensitive channel
MDLMSFLNDLPAHPSTAAAVVLALSLAAYVLVRYGLAQWIVRLTARSANQTDDVLVLNIRPYRMAWLAPLVVIYASARFFPAYQPVVAKAALFCIVWILSLTVISLLTAINTIYESRPTYNGVSIAGYLDIGKIVILLVALVLSVSLITNKSPTVLLAGLGAVAAVLMLVFQGTILSLVASVQIATNGLLREGDFIEVPAYDAVG